MATRTDIGIKCNYRLNDYKMRESEQDTIIATIKTNLNQNDRQVDIFSAPLNQLNQNIC